MLQQDTSNPVYNLIESFKLLFISHSNNSAQNITYTRKLLVCLQNIFKSKVTSEAFTYFCIRGAATAWILQVQLSLPENDAYYALKQLRVLKIIEPATWLRKKKGIDRGGPRPIMWALKGATNEEIADAINLHYRSLSPKYRVAEEVAQTILDEYKAGEITYREIIVTVKELRVPYSASDIARLAAQYLHEKGVKVWR